MKHSSHIFETYKRQGNINIWSISICIEDQIIKRREKKGDTQNQNKNQFNNK